MEHEGNQGLEKTFTSLSVYAFRKSLESLVQIEVSISKQISPLKVKQISKTKPTYLINEDFSTFYTFFVTYWRFFQSTLGSLKL